VGVIATACQPVEGVDPSFGTSGTVASQVAPGYSGEEIHDLAVQQDDKIVAAGFVSCYQCSSVAGVARYHANGSIDTTFSGDGKLIFSWQACCASDATSVKVQADGKIVVGGGVHLTRDGLPGVARFNPDGSPDVGFGTSGKVTTTLPGPVSSYFADIAVQADGKIVGVASTGDLLNSQSRLAVIRYLPTGALDTTFGAGGVAYVASPVGGACVNAAAVAVQNDGKIVVAGDGRTCDGSTPGEVARLLSDGRPDTSFASDGVATIPHPMLSWLSGLAVQEDGRIVVGGDKLMRLTASGSPDASFGWAGVVETAGEDEVGAVNDVAVRGDGVILTVHNSNLGMVIVHWRPNGTYETPTVVQVRKGSLSHAVAVQSDGKVVAGGYSYGNAHPYAEFALVRVPAQRTTPTIVNPRPPAGGGGGGGGGVTKPVETYAPVVYIAPLEQYTPSSGDLFVANSRLRWSHDTGCTDHELAPEGFVDPVALGFGGYTHETANDPVSLPPCEHTGDVFSSSASTRPNSGWITGNEGFFLDLNNDDRPLLGLGASAPVYYVYKDKHFISYWFFYAFNDGPGEDLGEHEGDWEHVAVRLDCQNQPIEMAYAQHTGEEFLDWAEVPFENGHPVVFSARGSHASYPDTGENGWHDLGFPGGADDDFTGYGAIRWDTQYNLVPLSTQVWRGYGGAWGEVGEPVTGLPPGWPSFDTTGPQGPRWPEKKSAPNGWYGQCVQ
jgi:uncharacterized delta-60 repeat protein